LEINNDSEKLKNLECKRIVPSCGTTLYLSLQWTNYGE